MLPRSNNYCWEIILSIYCCFPPFPICLLLLICIFYLTCSFLLPCRLSQEWDHLCPRYLGVIFHPSGTICAQNVDFTWKKVLLWRNYFANLFFPHFSFVCFYLYIFLFDLSFFACLSIFNQVGQTVPKIFRDDFFSWMGPSVHEILRRDFLPTWDHLCPKRKILPRSNYYCGEIILPICYYFFPVSHLYRYF